jgi:hypothetical protein
VGRLIGANGLALDGNGDRRPGDDFSARFGRGTALRYTDLDRDQVSLVLTGGGVMDLVQHSAAASPQIRISGATTSHSLLTGKVKGRTGGDGRSAVEVVSPVERSVALPGIVSLGPAPLTAALDMLLESGDRLVAVRPRQ